MSEVTFWGADTLKLDDRRRFAMPAKHRAALQSSHQRALENPELADDYRANSKDPNKVQLMVLPSAAARSPDPAKRKPSLWLFPKGEWQVKYNKDYRSLNVDNDEEHDQLIKIHNNIEQIEMDAQSRVLIPPKFLERFKMDSEIRLVSIRNFFEVWGQVQWDKWEAEYDF